MGRKPENFHGTGPAGHAPLQVGLVTIGNRQAHALQVHAGSLMDAYVIWQALVLMGSQTYIQVQNGKRKVETGLPTKLPSAGWPDGWWVTGRGLETAT